MKRSALSRGAGPQRRTPLASGRTRLRAASPKTIAARPSKAAVREAVFARDGYGCRLSHLGRCFGDLTPHHLRKAGQGGAYSLENMVALCAFDNGRIEDEALWAHSVGLVQRDGDTPDDVWLRLFRAGLAASPEVGSGPVAS